MVPTTAIVSFAAIFSVTLAGKQVQLSTHGRSQSNVVPSRYSPQRAHRRVQEPLYSASEMFRAFSDFDTPSISNHIDDHGPVNYMSFGGIQPQHLSTILSHLGINSLERLHRMPVVAEHLYGTPERVIIKDRSGPPKKIHGFIQSFHTVKTIDHGGRTVEGSKRHSGGLPEGDFSDYTGYEDFEFPPDW